MNPFAAFSNTSIPRPQAVLFVTLPNGNILSVPPDYAPPRRYAEPVPPPVQAPRAFPEAAPRFLRDDHGNLYERKGERIRLIEPAPEETETETAPEPPVLKPLLEGKPIRRLLRFGEWRELLSTLLQQPERLSDGHQISCELSLYELGGNTDAESLGRIAPAPMKPLDRAAAEKLGLGRLAPAVDARPRGVPNHWKGERFFTARVVHDPTAEPPRPAPAARPRPQPGPQEPRTRIPAAFIKPWEFRLTREAAMEALRGAAEHPSWRERVARFLLRQNRTAAIAEWRRALAGRPLDEQLWAVPPPSGAVPDPEIRRWAAETLAAARYDVPKMLVEWQLYWTRKGN